MRNTFDIEHGLSLEAAEWIEERASILEFEGGLTRDAANLRAIELWVIWSEMR